MGKKNPNKSKNERASGFEMVDDDGDGLGVSLGWQPPHKQMRTGREQADAHQPRLKHGRGQEMAVAHEKSKKRRKKHAGASGFEVVPQDFEATAIQTPRGTCGSDFAKSKNPNTLRRAHRGAAAPLTTASSSAAERKGAEIWFRKCGHGERLFADYYRNQHNIIPPDKWREFEACLNTSLPVTFRLHVHTQGGGGRDGAEQARAFSLLRAHLEQQLVALKASVQLVPWAPASAGIYQANIDKRTLARDCRSGEAAGDRSSSELAALLADGVSTGMLNRQEAVSMLPVMALEVQAGMCCLDMCASPGSKTMQLLEAVASGTSLNGLVIANDAHPKRVQQLLDTLDRHSRPASERARCVVTCHRGEQFPLPYRPFISQKKLQGTRCVDNNTTSAEEVLLSELTGFDRVLCDVPCSGDGTIRKDPTVRPRWTPAVGNQLHAIQVEIAWRGVELMRVGGLMAYSTCTYNPVEDEAVVAALLSRANAISQGSLTLQPWPASLLPKLVRHAGVSSWRVAEHVERASSGTHASADAWRDDEQEVALRWHATYVDAVAANMPHAVPSMWPPTQAGWMRLERCSRLLPHDQNTGGFFVALLRKHAPLGAQEQEKSHAPPEKRQDPEKENEKETERGKAGKMASGAKKGKKLARSGPAGCRELPQLAAEQHFLPLPTGEAEEVGEAYDIPVALAKRRLLSRQGGGAGVHEQEVYWAPAAMCAFRAGALNIARAGVTLGDASASGRLPARATG